MGIIYKISNDINDKIYIGQTKLSLSHRWSQHISCALNEWDIKQNRKSALYCAIRKYGSQHFSIEIIEECNNDLLDNKEQYYIEKYNSLSPNGYNILRGGAGMSKLNYDEVVKWYYECNCNQNEVFRQHGVIPRTTRKILRDKGILQKRYARPLDKNDTVYFYECDEDLNIIKTFNSIKDAQEFYPEIPFTYSGLVGVFNRVKKGKRRKYHGHLFIRVNDYQETCQKWNKSADC